MLGGHGVRKKKSAKQEVKKMTVITICGSMKFEKEMKQIAWNLEVREGFSVIQCVYNEQGEGISDEDQKRLAAAHYRKIDVADAIYVVDIGGYIGQSVAAEILYAEQAGKDIIYHSRFAAEKESI